MNRIVQKYSKQGKRYLQAQDRRDSKKPKRQRQVESKKVKSRARTELVAVTGDLSTNFLFVIGEGTTSGGDEFCLRYFGSDQLAEACNLSGVFSGDPNDFFKVKFLRIWFDPRDKKHVHSVKRPARYPDIEPACETMTLSRDVINRV